MLDGMYVTKSISTGLYPNLDLWTANKLQLQQWIAHVYYGAALQFVIFFYFEVFITKICKNAILASSLLASSALFTP